MLIVAGVLLAGFLWIREMAPVADPGAAGPAQDGGLLALETEAEDSEGSQGTDPGTGGTTLRSVAEAGAAVAVTTASGPPWELVVRVTRRLMHTVDVWHLERAEQRDESGDGEVVDEEQAEEVRARRREANRPTAWPARIRLVYGDRREPVVLADATTGTDGVAVIDLSPLHSLPPLALAPNVRVLVTGDEAQPHEERVWLGELCVPPPEGDARIEREIELYRARRVVGRVTDGHGQPIAGALVDVGNRWNEHEAVTDRDGRYEHGGIAGLEGTFHVVASHPDHGMASSAPVKGDGVGKLELPDLVLTSDVSVEGEVTLPDGSPLSDVEVWGYTDGDHGQGFRTRTDARGRFRIAANAATRVQVAPEVEGFEIPRRDWSPGDSPIRFVLDAYRIDARVKDHDGRPLPGVQVYASPVPVDWARAFAIGQPGDLPLIVGKRLTGAVTNGPRAVATLLVPSGVTVLVGARLADLVVEAAVVGLDAGGVRTLELALAAPSARGSIRVDLGGAEVVPGSPMHYSIHTYSGHILALDRLTQTGQIAAPVPSGLWFMQVISEGTGRKDRDPDLSEYRLPWWGPVRVRTGEETIVVAPIRRGGRIRIAIGDGPLDLTRVRVVLRRKGADGGVPITRFGRQAVVGEGDFWVGPGLARPRVLAVDLIEPGEYILRFEPGEDGTPQEVPVVVRADEITEVRYDPR